MANIQNLKVIQDESGAFLGGALTDIDLAYTIGTKDYPKEVTGVYIKILGTAVTEYSYPAQGTRFVTKLINPSNGQFAYLDEEVGKVEILLVTLCEQEGSENLPSQKVNVTNECSDPVHVSDCDKQEYLDALTAIKDAVNEVELTAETINLNSEQINLSVDQVEEKLDTIIGLSTPILMQNKSYKLEANQSITFEYESIFAWVAGVYNGTANYTEGGDLIGDYIQGESFGNGDQVNKILNLNEVTINSLADGDVRISVLQVPNYQPIIS